MYGVPKKEKVFSSENGGAEESRRMDGWMEGKKVKIVRRQKRKKGRKREREKEINSIDPQSHR